VKKVRVFFWMDARQKDKLTELSKKNRVLPSYYLKEAIDDLLKKYEQLEEEQCREVDTNLKVKVREG
jgi:predicted DNA-binding protein